MPEFLSDADVTKSYLARTRPEFAQATEQLDQLLEEFRAQHEAVATDQDRNLKGLQQRFDKFEPFEL
jgi:hypothetical protein